MATALSRKMAAKFKPGTRVVATDGPDIGKNPKRRYGTMQGTVVRAVQGNNAQGGHATIEWDNGAIGRLAFGTIARVEDVPEQKA